VLSELCRFLLGLNLLESLGFIMIILAVLATLGSSSADLKHMWPYLLVIGVSGLALVVVDRLLPDSGDDED